MFSPHPPRGEGLGTVPSVGPLGRDEAALPGAHGPQGGPWGPTGPEGPAPSGLGVLEGREETRRETEWGEGRGAERDFEGFEARREEEDVFRDRGERSASAEAARDSRREEKKRKAGRDKAERKENVAWVVSVYTVVLLLLFLACAVAGVFVGIIVTSPTVRVATSALRLDGTSNENEADVYGSPSVWHFRVNAAGNLEMGGNVTFALPLINPSIFTLDFAVDDLSVFYYPIGKSFQCLLYHGGIIGDEEQPLFLHRELIANPTNGNSSRYISPLSLSLKPTDGSISEEATFRIQTAFGVEVPAASLPEVKPIFDDCRQHQTLIYAVEVGAAYSNSPLTRVQMPGPIEVVAALACSIGPGVEALFSRVDRVFKSVILANLENKDLVFDSGVP
ncbi:putative transmembrane protein [Toxoplasma gondii p89]|nr:putative transmembrane protein [Toxoplasma gondii p89]